MTRGYTARGQLHTLAAGLTTIDTRGYDDGGRMISSVYNNGVSESRSYNSDNTLASISFSGASIGNLTYTWDANQNKTSESITGVMSGYGFSVGSSGYDTDDRLVNWDRSDANLDQSWDLSPVGDWNSITENSSVQNRTHGPAHEILTAAIQTVEHDPKGNTTLIPAVLRSGSDPLALKWDFNNKLSAADTNNDGIDDVFYKWDALGRRVGRDDGTDDVVYFQDGQQILADYPAGTAATSPTYTYIYGSYIDEPVLRTDSSGTKRYYHRNQQYSIVALTDGVGAISERYAYTAYGEPTVLDESGNPQPFATHQNRYQYTGREWDEALSLFHYRARVYSPAAGRFLSRDPVRYIDGALLYGFLLRAVLKKLDPYGLYATTDNDVNVVLGCLGPKFGTNIDPQTFPGTISEQECNQRPFQLALNQKLLDEWGSLNADIVLAMIKPALGEGVPGVVAEEIASQILSLIYTGNTELTPEKLKEFVTKIITERLNEELDPSWETQKAIEQIANALSGLIPTDFAKCQSVLLAGGAKGESSVCHLEICAKPHPIKGYRIVFSVTGFCFYTCTKTGSQRCCCGTSRRVALGATTGSALDTGSDCSVNLGPIR